MSDTETDVRVRYGRLENRAPKNTLVTFRENDTLYFGIARCRKDKDVFNKKVGSYIAEQRAFLAKDDNWFKPYNQHSDTTLKVHSSGLRGCLPVENVYQLITYFNNIDSYCVENLTPKTVKV